MAATPTRQALRSQATRDQIAQAALAVFALKGYSAASMDDVCLAAGCSKGGLYHHYPTKSAVLAGVVERLIRGGALLPPFRPMGDLPETAMGRVLIEVWAEAARDPALRALLRAGYEAHLDATLGGAEDGKLAEILRIGTLIQLLTRGEDISAAEVARRLGIPQAA